MAKQETLLSKLITRANTAGVRRYTDDSRRWFRDKVRLMGNKTAFDKLQRDGKRTGRVLERNPGVGFMYTFHYKAKLDGVLPYWDRFPLIFVIGLYDDGFLGMNLHYLPPKARAALMDKLLTLANNTRYDNRTKLVLSYDLLKSASRFKLFKPTIKRYLTSHLQTGLIKIPSAEWEPAIYLPTESFKGSSKSNVWSESMRMK